VLVRAQRPRLKVPWGPLDRLLFGLGVLGVVLLLGLWFASWPVLPQRVPVHFDLGGEPTRWGHRPTLAFVPLLGTALFGLLAALTRIPHLYNYPWPITPINAEAQYRLGRRLVLLLGAHLSWVFLAVYAGNVAVAAGVLERLGRGLLALTLGLPLAIVAWYFFAASRQR
jgi:hypothetical protein